MEMRSREEIAAAIEQAAVIAVVRARSEEQVQPLARALVDGGVTAVEITLSTPNAIEAIRGARRHFGGGALIGVGTVLDMETCRGALEAGAEFVVTPITRPALIEPAHAAGRPIMLGACTPTEAQTAHEAGADFIKLFPADGLGPRFVKAIRAPLPHLKIVPTGGVDLSSIAEFFKAGCAAVGAGSALISGRILAENDWAELRRQAERFAAAARAAKAG